MRNTIDTTLIKYILPSGFLDDFVITSINEMGETLTIKLDEKNLIPEEHKTRRLESKRFYPGTRIEDFPIRELKVYLSMHRRKWKDLVTGQVVSRDWDITAKGTSYTKEFGAFLKEMARYSSGQHQ